MMSQVLVKNFYIGKGQPLAIMSGPCVIESEDHCMRAAATLKEIFSKFPMINFIFKSSYDKANRTSIHSFRGPGIEEGLRILEKVKKEFDLPIVSDIHEREEVIAAAAVCDILQVPAFLSRQTDLICAAAKTGAVISVKKGQFSAPWDMENVVSKIKECGNDRIILVDRGVSFGYNNLVSDMRAIPIMQNFNVPVCFDATHSVQLPGGKGTSSGGQREFIPHLAKAAVAAGANAIFMEAHNDPACAKSDASSVLDFKDLPALLEKLQQIYAIVNE